MTLYMSISWIWSNLNFVMIFFINCCGQFSDIQESGIDKNFFSILIGGRTRVALTPGSGIRIPLALFCSLKGCAGATCIYLIPKLIWTLKASQCAQCWRLSIQDPHPLCAQQLEQNHGLLLMTDFKDSSHWSIHPFVNDAMPRAWGCVDACIEFRAYHSKTRSDNYHWQLWGQV